MSEEKVVKVVNQMDVSGYMQKAVDRGVQAPHDPNAAAIFWWQRQFAAPRNFRELANQIIIWTATPFLGVAVLCWLFEPLRMAGLIPALLALLAIGGIFGAILRHHLISSIPGIKGQLQFRQNLMLAAGVCSLALFFPQSLLQQIFYPFGR